jgi:hypothetical protein
MDSSQARLKTVKPGIDTIMSATTLRDRILEIKSMPTSADIGVKALVKKLKPEFGDDVNAKSVRQQIEGLEKSGALQSAPAQDAVVSAVFG